MTDNHFPDQLEQGEQEPSNRTEVARENLASYFDIFNVTYLARVKSGETWDWARRRGIVAGFASSLATRLSSDITPASFTADALKCADELFGDEAIDDEDEGAQLVRSLMTDPAADSNKDADTMQRAIPSLARAALPGDETFAAEVTRILNESLSATPPAN